MIIAWYWAKKKKKNQGSPKMSVDLPPKKDFLLLFLRLDLIVLFKKHSEAMAASQGLGSPRLGFQGRAAAATSTKTNVAIQDLKASVGRSTVGSLRHRVAEWVSQSHLCLPLNRANGWTAQGDGILLLLLMQCAPLIKRRLIGDIY